MNIINPSPIPDSEAQADAWLAVLLSNDWLTALDEQTFLNGWAAISYKYPGLHPDGFEDPDSGWPAELRTIANEAWFRYGEAPGDERKLYQCDAQMAGYGYYWSEAEQEFVFREDA